MHFPKSRIESFAETGDATIELFTKRQKKTGLKMLDILP